MFLDDKNQVLQLKFQKTLSHFQTYMRKEDAGSNKSKLNLSLCDLICVLIKKFLLDVFDHYLNYS